MSEPLAPDSFESLLQRVFDGKLTDAERECLAAMIEADPARRAAYLEHCQFHALLRSEHGLLAACAPEEGEAAPAWRFPIRSRRTILGVGAAAAALLVAVGLTWKSTTSPAAPFRGKDTAVLKTAIGVQFAFGAHGETATASGASMPGGAYVLKSGIIELEYATGVLVTIQAPARFELVDEKVFRLQDGRIAAHVPQRGVGFKVEAPAATVVDLGTDFAVDANADDNSEVHVFKGEVRVDLRAAKGVAVDPLRLLTGQAARIDVATGLPAGIDLDEQRFIRSLRAKSRAYAQHVLALGPAVYYGMEPVGDGMQLVDQSKSRADAKIVLGKATTPVWVSGKIGAALQLGGPAEKTYAYAARYPQATGNELSVVAWVYARTRPRWASIAKNWAGAQDRGQFHFGLLDDVGALEAHIADANGQEIMVRDSEPLPLNQWHHVAMVADGSMLRLYRNGRAVSAVPYDKLTSDSRILALAVGTKLNLEGTAPEERDFNMWDGRLDELAIFNHALTGDDVLELYELARTAD